MLPQGPYNYKESEAEMLKFWLANKFYKPEYDPRVGKVLSTEEMKSDDREPFSIICPPPNAYGRPHLGNISGYAYQDAMGRYARMRGKKVLLVPGKDHAGLEGEGVFVRDVLEKEGTDKFSMTRDEFYQRIWDFNQQNMELALNDEQVIGLSADFDRNLFTLDPRVVDIVLSTFVEMYKQKMIYKGVRVVNWDPKARSAVADNQCVYKDAVNKFVYFKYGFKEADPEAIKIKHELADKEITWNFERNRTKDGKSDLPFAYGQFSGYQINGHDINVIGIGYTNPQQQLTGQVIGMQMRLDNDFRLVVQNPEFSGDLAAEIERIFLFEMPYYGGAHIILFAQYPDDQFYNNGFILGTVRPETKFGDTAIAVNPSDPRYQEFVGKQYEVRTLNGIAAINVISDHFVEKEFGTGMVKVTPAHSPDDWEIAQRHPQETLPAKQVIGFDLRLNHLTGKYAGLKIKEARNVIMEDMKAAGMLIYVDENYQNRIRIAERTGAEIEPLLSSQWYIDVEKFKQPVIEMVKSGQVKIHPQNMEDKFFHWMENLRDWAISRSLWWGYRLPVWYAGPIEEKVNEVGAVVTYITIDGKEQELDLHDENQIRVQTDSPGAGWVQDENVLDTWFSSGQWPYATLEVFDLMNVFFPTDVMETAHDILENWVSRMMMFSWFKYKQIPFKDVYLHGIVKGTDGQKMSKSKKNIIPLDETKDQYGLDALRMVYFYQNSAGASYALTHDKLKNFRNFNNKIWNAAKFTLSNIADLSDQDLFKDLAECHNINEFINFVAKHRLQLQPIDEEMIEQLKTQETDLHTSFERFRFGNVTENLYDNFWHFFCDKYIEEIKDRLWIEKQPDPASRLAAQCVIYYALKSYMKMLHPFVPFITEQIWQHLPKSTSDPETIMYSTWNL